MLIFVPNRVGYVRYERGFVRVYFRHIDFITYYSYFYTSIMESLDKNYVVVDIEAISLSKNRVDLSTGYYSSIHNCIRKIALLFWDNSIQIYEFCPCVTYSDLHKKERLSFNYCRRVIHGLSFVPFRCNGKCADSLKLIRNLLREKDVNIVLFKGGTLEKDLCRDLNIDCVDLEKLGVPKYRGKHDPLQEVIFFRDKFVEIVMKWRRRKNLTV